MASPAQTFTTLVSFAGTDAGTPGFGPLIQATDGQLYGTTQSGGAYGYGPGLNGAGTIFKLTTSGTLTSLYSFCAQVNCTDGQYPAAGLVQGADENFYGTTSAGGANGSGTVFRFTMGGTFTTLHSFKALAGPMAPTHWVG
jgi:uncharacterized repeat protein (TIGR03803 family)